MSGLILPPRFAIGCALMLVISLVAWVAIIACARLAFGQEPPRAYQGQATVLVTFTSERAANSLCRTLGLPSDTWACANANQIIIPNPCEGAGRYAERLCHELGHVNGWVH